MALGRLDLARAVLAHRHEGRGPLDGVRQNCFAPLNGTILYFGASGNLPPEWAVCDGTRGTTDMRNRFVMGATDDSTSGKRPGDMVTGVTSFDWSHTHGAGTLAFSSPSHGHSAESGGPSTSSANAAGGPWNDRATNIHTHTFTWGSQTHTHTFGGSTGSSGSAAQDSRPKYVGLFYIKMIGIRGMLRYRTYTSLRELAAYLSGHRHVGLVPVGGILFWSGSTTALPRGRALCNGQTVNGVTTPNMSDAFVVGAGSTYANGATGGNSTVNLDHANGNSFTIGTTTNAAHSVSTSGGNGAQNSIADGGSAGPPLRTHTHSVSDGSGGSHTHSFTGGITATSTYSAVELRPPYYTLAYSMRVF